MFPAHTVRLKDGSTAEIRQARPGDAEALIAHVNSVGAEEVFIATERVDRTPEQEREKIRSFDGVRALFLVAVRDGTLVGSADFTRGKALKNSHVASFGIAIGATARGLGLGESMLRDGLGWCERVGVEKVWLAVFASNERAIALYRKFGFELEGRLKGQVVLRGVPTDELLMSKWVMTR